MPVADPWGMVIAAQVPASISWRALSDLPAVPYTLASVVPVEILALVVQVEYGMAEISWPDQLAWRSFVALVTMPEDEGDFPFTVKAFAVVETEGAEALLGVFVPTYPVVLTVDAPSVEISGFLQVTKYP